MQTNANIWTALGDPTRRTVFELLIEHPCSVGELACALPVTRSAVSQHLKVLKNAGLVIDTRSGKERIYRIDPDGLRRLRAEIDRFWNKTLAAYKEVAETVAEGAKMKQPGSAPVKNFIVVETPIAHAFKVFTQDFGKFKPSEHNMLAVPIAETVFETHVGGQVYDRGADGSECRWARVLAYDPPNRVLLSWDISPYWQIETDLDKTSEWEVTFTAETPDRTRVEIEHRNLERHGDGWEGVRDGVAGNQGWPLYLRRFNDLFSRRDV